MRVPKIIIILGTCTVKLSAWQVDCLLAKEITRNSPTPRHDETRVPIFQSSCGCQMDISEYNRSQITRTFKQVSQLELFPSLSLHDFLSMKFVEISFPSSYRCSKVYPAFPSLCFELYMIKIIIFPPILSFFTSPIMVNEQSYDLHQAACKGQFTKVKELIERKGIDLDELSPKGETAIYLAACNGHLKVVKLLAEAGADKVFPPTFFLFFSIISFPDDALLLILLQNIANSVGQTPLFEAVWRGRDDVALYLIEQGADLEKANYKLACPLFMAAQCGRNVVAKALIAKGVDLNQVSKWKQTPLSIAVQCNQPRVVKTLVESGADVNRFEWKGYTPLALAVERGFVEIAVYLMKEGKADMKTRTNKLIMKQGRRNVGTKPGYTLMDLAEKCNRPDAMKQAIRDEEKRRKRGKSGKTRVEDDDDGETTHPDEATQPRAKKQRLSDDEGEEAEDIIDID